MEADSQHNKLVIDVFEGEKEVEKELLTDESPTRELPDLTVTTDQAEETKGGGGDIVPTDQPSLNFAKIKFE